jgi:hypothetical protein
MTTTQFTSSLFAIEVDMHIAHLQSGSYAEHMALNELYTGIVDLRDRFIESYQGKYGILKGYTSFSIQEGVDPITYLKNWAKEYEPYRVTLTDGYLQQICDDILELVNSTLYKLKFLK